jgi:hypothetical protein
LKKRKPKKIVEAGPSILELLDKVEAEMTRLRAENRRLAPKGKPPALGKGLSQLFQGPKRLG